MYTREALSLFGPKFPYPVRPYLFDVVLLGPDRGYITIGSKIGKKVFNVI